MGTVATALGRHRFNSGVALLTVTIATAWAIAFWAERSGTAGALHQDSLYHASRPLWASALLLLGS